MLNIPFSDQREEIQQSLKDKDIPSVSYYSVPLHLQPEPIQELFF